MGKMNGINGFINTTCLVVRDFKFVLFEGNYISEYGF